MSLIGSMVLLAPQQTAGEPAKESAAAAIAVHMCHGRRKKNLGLAFGDVKRC